MRLRIFLFTLLAVLLVRVPAHAQGIVYEVFGSYLDALREQAGIPGVAATIVDRNGVAWEGAYGRQDVARAIAARTDTPFNADGLTQVFTATMILRCAEEGRLSIDDRIGSFKGTDSASEPDASIRQLLTHTSGPPESATFALRPERLAPLWPVVRACAVDSYRETFANLLARFGMMDSVPGPNIVNVAPPAEGVPDPNDAARYAAVLQRRALPYAVDDRGRATESAYPAGAAVLTPATGLVTTVRDLANFDLELKRGFLEADTLNAAWSTPVDAAGSPLPHGLGWFVQYYNGEKVVWQFGVGDNASSSLMITLPARGLTFIVMANSDRLVRPFALDAGDVSVSPFARLFLNLFVR